MLANLELVLCSDMIFSLQDGQASAEQLQQLAGWLSKRDPAALLYSLRIEDADSRGLEPEAWDAYLEALRGLVAALARATLQHLTISTSACYGSQLDADGLLQLPCLLSLRLQLGGAAPPPRWAPQLQGSLTHLSQLTRLSLVGWELRAELPWSLRELSLLGGSYPDGALMHHTQLTQLAILHSQAATQLPPSLHRLVLLGRPGPQGQPDPYWLQRYAHQRLRALGVADSCRGPLAPPCLAPHTQLTYLRLECCQFNEDTEAALEPLQRLVKLEAADCRHVHAHGVLGLPRLPALQVRWRRASSPL